MTAPGSLTRAEFDELWRACSTWGDWGPDDERGTLNHVTPREVAAAARLVRAGRTVSCGRVLDVQPGPDNPKPAEHRMTQLPTGVAPVEFATDSIGLEFHGHAHSHIDALCHVAFEGRLHNAVDVADALGETGATRLAVDAFAAGVVSRGVLLDLPRLRRVRWLEPGEVVSPDEVAAGLAAEGVSLGQGDVLLVRTGHGQKRRVEGPWNVSALRAGLHPTVLPLLRERRVAAVGLDGDPDPMPSVVDGIRYPVLAIGTVAMGMPFLDSLALDELAAACAGEGRWEFLFVVAPLRIPGGTGSPVNPIAVL